MKLREQLVSSLNANWMFIPAPARMHGIALEYKKDWLGTTH